MTEPTLPRSESGASEIARDAADGGLRESAATAPDEPKPPRIEPGSTIDLAPRVQEGWGTKRRAKIAAEIARNRRGEYRVPTWVLTVLLVVIVGAWLTLILTS